MNPVENLKKKQKQRAATKNAKEKQKKKRNIFSDGNVICVIIYLYLAERIFHVEVIRVMKKLGKKESKATSFGFFLARLLLPMKENKSIHNVILLIDFFVLVLYSVICCLVLILYVCALSAHPHENIHFKKYYHFFRVPLLLLL